jgi:hypothetical protein
VAAVLIVAYLLTMGLLAALERTLLFPAPTLPEGWLAAEAQAQGARRLLQLHTVISEDEQDTGQQAQDTDFTIWQQRLQHSAPARANHTGALGAAPCAGCAAGLACPDALALAVATALLTCLLTLLCLCC